MTPRVVVGWPVPSFATAVKRSPRRGIEDEDVTRIIGSMAANRQGFKTYAKTRMGGGFETLQEYVTRLSGVRHALTEGSFSQGIAGITEQLKTYAEQQVPADLAILEGWQGRLAK